MNDNPGMLPRFYAPDLDRELASVTLPADEARHLTRVLRLGAGDEAVVFDGRGVVFRAVVEAAVRDTASLRLIEPVPAPASPAVQMVVVQAVLKGSSMDDAIRDATMMGAVAIEPVLTAHADVKASFVRRPETVERWRRVALAAVKQSRRPTLPVIEEPRTFEAWLAAPSGEMKLLFVEPSARCAPQTLKMIEHHVPARAAVLLGPEGGWAASEIEAALQSGCVAVTLGPLTLRAESMPVAALAALTAIWPA
ncbi:MAG TPA: RsmE family RNA methyltransferase [Vicinamibacterales bacterium]|nr:RsmE family RNA methyltransferase [Vicinamibacterales bacterium]